jgi:hypothetical protein
MPTKELEELLMDHVNEVVGNVRIFAVEAEGPEIRVDIYGGDEGLCGSIGYRFPHARRRAENIATLSLWCQLGTPLTLMRGNGTVTLVDEAGALEDLFDR